MEVWVLCPQLQLVSSRDHISRVVAMGSLLKVLWDGLGIVSGPMASKPHFLAHLEM